MYSLNEISRKKILIVVAHPDDETLWFYQAIQTLKHSNEVVILCMTHAAVSKRGRELQAVADKYGLKVIFGHCQDTGIDKLLREEEVRQAFIKVFSKYKFDVVITHPPHGGEKPHPHHLQMYLATKEFSSYHKFSFGFFSERLLLENNEKDNHYFMSLKNKKYIIHRHIESYRLMSKEEGRFSFILWLMMGLIFNRDIFAGFKVKVDIKQKQKALLEYSSQREVLKSYQAFYEHAEYLFLQQH